MADEKNTNGAATQDQAARPMLQELVQYTKDLSFENPGAPNSLRGDQPAPQIDIGLEVGRQKFDDNTVEVTLSVKISAMREKETFFILELEHGGLFSINVKPEEIDPITLIECPRLLFPFVRQIITNVMTSAGLQPLRLESPDFVGMFRAEINRRAQKDS